VSEKWRYCYLVVVPFLLPKPTHFKSTNMNYKLRQRRLRQRISLLISGILLLTTQTFAHGVQVGYCVMPSGYVRIYLEHWHGDQTTASLMGNGMSITTSYGGNTITQNLNPTGAVNNTGVASLPSGGSGVTILAGCPGDANTWNDWAYYDFAPAACNTPVSITLNQGLTVVLEEACTSLFPQTINATFTDNAGPVINCSTVTANLPSNSCSGTNVSYNFTAIDACAGPQQVSYSIAPGSFFPVGTTMVTASSTDPLNNTSTCTFAVNVVDATSPVINGCPSNQSACGNTIPDFTGTITASDNCTAPGSIIVTQTPVAGSPIAPGMTVNITLTAKDAANNPSSCSFNFTSSVAPAFTSCPGNIQNVTAPGLCNRLVNYSALASGIPAPSISYSFSGATTASGNGAGSGSVFNKGVTNVTVTASNSCGSVTCNFNVTINDNQAPVITAPQPLSLNTDAGQCGVSLANINLGLPQVNDNCPGVTFSHNAPSILPYGPTTITWTALDASGLTSTASQIVTVSDIEGPVVNCPASVTINCNDGSTVAALGSATATDNCAVLNITSSDASTQNADPSNSGYYNYTITRTWTATDIHNNISNCTQLITVQDITNPTLTLPGNVTLSCTDDHSTANTGSATGSDNCSNVSISFTESSTQNPDPLVAGYYNYTITRTWKATDISGNFTTGNQTITVEDVTNPSITCPAPALTSCNLLPVATGTATGSDNCSSVAISYTDASTQSSNPEDSSFYHYYITRTWKATDVTGNFSTCTQPIEVNNKRGYITMDPLVPVAGQYPKTIYLGYGPQSVTLTLHINGGTGPLSYSWASDVTPGNIGSPTSAATSVAPTDTTLYTATISDGTGCPVSISEIVYVIDAIEKNKIMICHLPPDNPTNTQLITVASSAVASHLAHGDYLGQCPTFRTVTLPKEIKVYPNPNNGMFTVELPATGKSSEIRVMDMMGRTIAKRNVGIDESRKIHFSMESVSKGMYFVEVLTGEMKTLNKLIIE
jgi:hypothetical protein